MSDFSLILKMLADKDTGNQEIREETSRLLRMWHLAREVTRETNLLLNFLLIASLELVYIVCQYLGFL